MNRIAVKAAALVAVSGLLLSVGCASSGRGSNTGGRSDSSPGGSEPQYRENQPGPRDSGRDTFSGVRDGTGAGDVKAGRGTGSSTDTGTMGSGAPVHRGNTGSGTSTGSDAINGGTGSGAGGTFSNYTSRQSFNPYDTSGSRRHDGQP